MMSYVNMNMCTYIYIHIYTWVQYQFSICLTSTRDQEPTIHGLICTELVAPSLSPPYFDLSHPCCIYLCVWPTW